ncbi:NAD(P)H:quinone oxidoreductase [Oceanobacillus profundus]|uniref:NAD(P)H:quinone oxidoreductase n=1 Tax=Oceanobacillus profundus TaxID=372463 RepID=A0A417YBQ7_9BACI|nr:NAD(P)H:quinone oxidoreductase [Oceanobacillus profundus]MBR3120506.1 NAD(P)H:quinone oxidoreductase [Oceanobacillus sp.]MDO6450906.1 NAD(P)H:quinone oxidoreductase [Oceanobacillus profundus]PAE27835.1 NAD(P)H:quinone oxidoreductase type IV [Paenibacillus sp. 7884-2]RHW30011.1 NAD(P)H:quinone oxidoreductase [Oceanobacillus profundus]
MSNVKLAVIFYSMGGTNYQLAKWAEEGAQTAGAEVRVLKVEELAPESVIEGNEGWKATVEATKDVPVATSEDIEWADAIIFSVPTRFGNMPSQMKQFLDIQGGIWAKGKTMNKVVSAMTSAQNPHGGQEATILSLYTSMMHWGAIIATPGYTDPIIYGAGGNPYGTSVTVDQEGKMIEDVQGAVKHQAKRTATVAEWVKRGIQ